MPIAPPRICGCGLKVASREACRCQQQRRAAVEKARPSARQRGYDREWEAARADYLAQPENRYCCCGCGKRADVVDHGKAHRGNRALFWDRSNWRPMAFACHSRKTAAEDGGFGNPRRSAP